MGRRSNFEKIPRDYYPTIDPQAVPETFLSFIRGKIYAEPCYGEGALHRLIGDNAKCGWASDIEVRGKRNPAIELDATMLTQDHLIGVDVIVTNPMFTWTALEPLLKHLPTLRPTWLLLPANVMHNKRMGPYMAKCNWVVSVGRLYWFRSQWAEGLSNHQVDNYTGWYDFSNNKPSKSEYTRGVDDYAWFCWDYSNVHENTKFVGRY